MTADHEPNPEGHYNLPPKPGKRLWRARLAGFLAVVVALVAGWSGLWYWAAGKLDAVVVERIETLTLAGIKTGCDDRAIIGYPFRLGVRCSRVSGSSENGLVEAGALRSAAQLYAPGKMVLELDAPMTIEPTNSAPVRIDWRLARASSLVRLSALPQTDIERLSVEMSEPRFHDGWNPSAPALATAAAAQLHYRQAPDTVEDIDLAANARQLVVEGLRLPPLAASISARVEAIRSLLAPGFDLADHIAGHGLKGTLHYLRLGEDGAQTPDAIEFSGPFEIDRAGLLSGRIKLVLSNVEAARPFARSLLGGQERAVDDLLKIIALLPAGTGNDGERSIVLRIDRGIVSAGIMELGRIPPLL